MSAPLAVAAQNDRRLRDELITRWPTLAEDEPALWDTLEGCSDGSFDMQISIALRMADEARMMAAGIAVRQEELTERKRRLGEREEAIRRAIMSAMEIVGRKTITLPEATLTVSRTAPQLIVTNDDDVPDGPWWVPQPKKLSKTALKAAIAEGREIPGARMSNGGASLVVRRG